MIRTIYLSPVNLSHKHRGKKTIGLGTYVTRIIFLLTRLSGLLYLTQSNEAMYQILCSLKRLNTTFSHAAVIPKT